MPRLNETARRLDKEPWAIIEVSDETMAMLNEIAKQLDCTPSAALEEAIREFEANRDGG